MLWSCGLVLCPGFCPGLVPWSCALVLCPGPVPWSCALVFQKSDSKKNLEKALSSCCNFLYGSIDLRLRFAERLNEVHEVEAEVKSIKDEDMLSKILAVLKTRSQI